MVLPTMVPPSAFFSIGWSTTLTSDSLSRRRGSSLGFLAAVGAAGSVPRALVAPAGEWLLLRSVGIWATPVEVICLRLVAAPLRAGLQFYGISVAFARFNGVASSLFHPAAPHSVPFFAADSRAATGKQADQQRRYQKFSV